MLNKKLFFTSQQRYRFLALLFIIFAGGLLFLPNFERQEGIPLEHLLAKSITTERYLSADELAHRIINKDPSLLLIDLRDEEQYKRYHIPGAVHVPFDQLLSENYNDYINQNAYDIVFYTNEHLQSDMAWIICSRLGYKNLNVLEGGLNAWYKNIIHPKPPTDLMPHTTHEQFSFRMAASRYFGVAHLEKVVENKKMTIARKKTKKTEPKKIVPVKKKKKMPMEGGCWVFVAYNSFSTLR